VIWKIPSKFSLNLVRCAYDFFCFVIEFSTIIVVASLHNYYIDVTKYMHVNPPFQQVCSCASAARQPLKKNHVMRKLGSTCSRDLGSIMTFNTAPTPPNSPAEDGTPAVLLVTRRTWLTMAQSHISDILVVKLNHTGRHYFDTCT